MHPSGPSFSPSTAATAVPIEVHPTEEPSTAPISAGSLICPVYFATLTYYAMDNYVVCSFVACSNTYLSIESNSSLESYAVLRDSQGLYLSAGSSFAYTTSSNSGCQTYQLDQGCRYYDSCSAQYTIFGGSSLAPTTSPTGPSQVPSPVPVPTVAPTFSTSVSCAFFSTTYTSDCTAADSDCPSCSFTACPSTTIQVRLTNANSDSYYQLFYIYGPAGEYVYSTYITKGGRVSYTLNYDGECTSFTLVASCGYDQTCSGAYVIDGAIAEPSSEPSIIPTGPSVYPTSLNPTTTSSPSSSPFIRCPFYNASNTFMATMVSCLFILYCDRSDPLTICSIFFDIITRTIPFAVSMLAVARKSSLILKLSQDGCMLACIPTPGIWFRAEHPCTTW